MSMRKRYGLVRKRRRRRHGGSIFSSINDFLKKHRIISTVGNALSSVGVPYAGAIGKAAGVLGYGRRRRRVGVRRRRVLRPRIVLRTGLGRRRIRRRRGGDLKSVLSNVHKFVKDKRLVSSALRHFLPNSNLHKAAHVAGYGRRRVHHRRVMRRHGGANFFSTEQIAVPKF